MYLQRLQTTNYRALVAVSATFHHRCNLVVGDNGAGKTSLLEAVRSLTQPLRESHAPRERCGPEGSHWAVRADIVGEDLRQPPTRYEVSYRDGAVRRRIGEQSATTVELARRIPVVFLQSSGRQLISEGPAQRRRYLDWLLFHVEPAFLPNWRRYQKALRQRQAALRNPHTSALTAWNVELARAGEALTALRRDRVDRLQAAIAEAAERLLGVGGWTLELHQGWPMDTSLLSALEGSIASDRRSGQTQHGPHRAELRLQRRGRSVRGRLSGGELKLLTAALLIQQALTVREQAGVTPLLLIDDFAAELGAAACGRWSAELARYPGQVVVTELPPAHPALGALEPHVFHVEHGHLRRMVE